MKKMTPMAQAMAKQLPSLSKDDLEALRLRIDALLGNRVVSSSRVDHSGHGLIVQAINDYIAGMGLPPVKRELTSVHEIKVTELLQFLQQAGVRDRNQQRVVLAKGVELLASNLSELKIPVTGRVLLTHIHRIPYLLEKSFPGYAREGVLSLMVRGNRE